jgi:YrbI family 3-deoxy-D-manno-octulosonate 8-phosphate phosphatase
MRREVLAIIPARGGSKGIPRKNLQLLKGVPLLAYSIEHALAANEIARVVVSTDDTEIGELALARGAEVVRRPAEISGDYASSESALLHVLKYLRDNENYEPELVVFLQATSPIRRPGDLDSAICKLRVEGADSLFAASRLNWFAWRVEGQTVSPLNYDPRKRPMRQAAPLDVIETGSFYIFKPWVLKDTQSRLGGRITVYMTGLVESMQVDETRDLELLQPFLPCTKVELHDIRLLALDFDGVLTDNYVWVDQHGNELVRCTRADSLGINRLLASDVQVVVISTERNSVVEKRCAKLGVECFHGCEDKAAILEMLIHARGLQPQQVAYLGNDVNDLDCFRRVGLPVAVGDATAEVKAEAKLVTRAKGGEAAVREVCDLIVEMKSAKRPREIGTATSS